MASTASILSREALARGRRPRMAPLPTTELPRHVDRAYLRELLELLAKARALVEAELVPELEAILREAAPPGAATDSLVTDRYTDRLERTIERVKITFGRTVTPEDFAEVVRRAGWRTVDVNRLKTKAQFKALLGIDVIGNDPALGELVRAFTRENVSLITSVSDRYFGEIEQAVIRGARAGTRADALSRELVERFDVAESRAAFIARDQTNKLNGDVTRARHTALGIAEYKWRTSKDDRVRPGHALLEGQQFSYKEPPVVDPASGRRAHPGGDYLCRCTAEPVLPGINEAPTPRVQPKVRATPAKLVPKGVPEGYAKHAVAPVGRFSMDRLRAALPRGYTRGAHLSREAQVVIRRELNAILAGEGMVERGIVANTAAAERKEALVEIARTTDASARAALEKRAQELERSMLTQGLAGRFEDGAELATVSITAKETQALGARAFHHSITGRVGVAPDVFKGFVDFTRTAPEQRTAKMVSDFRTMVHETVHGHSPMRPRVYQGVGAKLEEATTELAAQELTERLAPGWTFTFGAEASGETTVAGSYRGFIAATVRAVAEQLSVPIQKAKAYARTASIAMRRHAGPLLGSYEEYAQHFARQLPGVRAKVAKAERAVDAELADRLARARAGETRRVWGVDVTPETLDSAEVKASLEAELAYRKQNAAATVTKPMVERLTEELRGASPY